MKYNDKQHRTIRLLRRQVRRLKSELKSKDRLIFAQKEFYECMLDEVQKREDMNRIKCGERNGTK